MVQQGQTIELTRRGADGRPLWAYRYRTGGRDSKRVQRGGFASEQDARDALERELERVRREQRIARRLTLAELVDTYLAQHAERISRRPQKAMPSATIPPTPNATNTASPPSAELKRELSRLPSEVEDTGEDRGHRGTEACAVHDVASMPAAVASPRARASTATNASPASAANQLIRVIAYSCRSSPAWTSPDS
jgi:hypothetical protein